MVMEILMCGWSRVWKNSCTFSKISEFDGGYLSIVIAIVYFGTVYGLEKLGNSTLFTPSIRSFLTDHSFVFPTLFWVGFSHFPGRLENTGL
jgi:hypothetical protein